MAVERRKIEENVKEKKEVWVKSRKYREFANTFI